MWNVCGCHAIDKQFVFIFSNLLFIFFLDERKFSFVIYVAIVSRKRVSRSTRRTEDQSLGGRYADEKFHKTEKESWISNDLNSFVFRTLSLFFFSLCYDNLHIDFFGENVSRNSQETPPPSVTV